MAQRLAAASDPTGRRLLAYESGNCWLYQSGNSSRTEGPG